MNTIQGRSAGKNLSTSVGSVLVRFRLVRLAFGSVLATSLGLTLFGCKCDPEKQVSGGPVSAPVSSSPAPEVSAAPEGEPKKHKPLFLGHQYPIGPELIVVPGHGISAIRFGATIPTVERHMEAPCDKKSETRCLYVRHAVEYFFEEGKLVRAKVHRRDRQVTDPPENGEKYFGSFRGAMRPRIMIGLHRHVAVEEFGKPDRIEKIEPKGPDGQVERHFYDGVTIEYDVIENGNVVLSAMEVFPSDTVEVLPTGHLKRHAQPAAEGQKE